MVNENEKYMEKELELASNVTLLNEKCWLANSAREALAWLRVNIDWPSSVVAYREVSKGVEVKLAQRPFFRGQSNSTWAPIAGLYRISEKDRMMANTAACIMAAVVDIEFETLWSVDGAQNWPPVQQGAGYAAAQHYGMKTTLLDWTVNPSVAVDFATSNSDYEKAAIFCLPIDQASELGLKIKLPPPYINRLYLQRGVFIDLSTTNVEDLSKASWKIEFPVEPHLPVSGVDNEENRIFNINLLPEDKWFKKLKKWSNEKAQEISSEQNLTPIKLSFEFAKHHGHHPSLLNYSDLSSFYAHDIYKIIQDYIDRLARRNTNTGYCYDPKILNLIKRDNQKFFEWLDCAKIEFKRCY